MLLFVIHYVIAGVARSAPAGRGKQRGFAYRAARSLYRAVARVGGGERLGRIRRRVTRVRMRADDVGEVMGVLETAGVRAWVAGGWGTDALLGRQTRAHADLDLVVPEPDEDGALAALAAHGFRVVSREAVPNTWLGVRLLVEDAAGRSVDLHPVDLSAAPAPFDTSTTGVVGGHVVPCLPAGLQIRLREGYAQRSRDTRDVRRLRELEPDAIVRPGFPE
jgi:lincosamide nucleotidyltransferase A/C/D/E